MMELKVMTMLHMDIHQNEHRNRLNWGVPNMDNWCYIYTFVFLCTSEKTLWTL
jgi:hypothetical protein